MLTHFFILRVRFIIRGIDTGAPEALEHFEHLIAASTDLTLANGLHGGDQTRVLDHESHKLGGVTADGEELQAAVLLDKLLEGRVGCYPHTMSVIILQDLADLDERLNVSTRADDHDDNVQLGSRHRVDILGVPLEGGIDLLSSLSLVRAGIIRVAEMAADAGSKDA